MRDLTFVLILIGLSIVITVGITTVWGEEQPPKSIAFNWAWMKTPSLCFYTGEYQSNSDLAMRLWNQALGSNFRVDYRFVNFTADTSMCNSHVFFYPNVSAMKEDSVLGYTKCTFRHSLNPHCMLVIATSDRDFDFDYDTSLTTTIMHEVGHNYGLNHPILMSLMDYCIDDIMATPHCEKTLQVLPYHVNAIKCRYGDDGFGLPNYPECMRYVE